MSNNSRKILAVIPARGGSKGLPGKNLRQFRGKPLIAWSIEAAIKANMVDQFAVSSDDENILITSSEYGCEILIKRPEELAMDDITIEPVILHVLESLNEEFTHVLLLQPTSPLRTSEDIDKFLHFSKSVDDAPVISVTQTTKSPFISYTLDESGILSPLFPDQRRQRRQELPKTYVPNGALYFTSVERLIKEKTFVSPDVHAYIMPPERSVDIDTETDLVYAEFLVDKNIVKI